MTQPLKIDFVSDVACPWCAIGLYALEEALKRTAGEVEATLHFQPFELNPDMPPEGQDTTEHLTQKYGSTPAQQAAARESIRQRGAAVGFTFRPQGRDRVYNTFDAHRLLYWAGTEGPPGAQRALKKALLQAYHGEGRNPGERALLLDLAAGVGLDPARAAEILDGDAFAGEVRARERFYTGGGIQGVPAIVINDRHLISGGQPPEVFERALRQIAQQAEAA